MVVLVAAAALVHIYRDIYIFHTQASVQQHHRVGARTLAHALRERERERETFGCVCVGGGGSYVRGTCTRGSNID